MGNANMRELLKELFQKRHPLINLLTWDTNSAVDRFALMKAAKRVRTAWVEDNLDPLTSLLTCEQWLAFLRTAIDVALFPNTKEGEGRLTDASLERARKHPVSIWFSNVAFVRLLNEIVSDQAGDSLLRSLAKTALTATASGAVLGRYRSDEFVGAFPDESLEHVLEQIYAWKKGMMGIQVDFLTKKNLPLHVDIGVAALEEAVQYLLEPNSRRPRSLRVVAETLVNLARHRALYLKCVARVQTLAKLLVDDPRLYDELFDSLAKGASNPTRDEIGVFADLLQKGDHKRLSTAVKRFALEKHEIGPEEKFALAAYREQLEGR